MVVSNVTGNGLHVLIVPEEDWMAFACWYSIHRNMPDATIFISLPKTRANRFRWVARAGLRRYNGELPVLVVPSDTIAVRGLSVEAAGRLSDKQAFKLYEEPDLVSPSHGNRNTPFVTVEKCGTFNKKTWPPQSHPFAVTRSLVGPEMSRNEIAVLDLWSQMQTAYRFMG